MSNTDVHTTFRIDRYKIYTSEPFFVCSEFFKNFIRKMIVLLVELGKIIVVAARAKRILVNVFAILRKNKKINVQ